jgi:pyruvate dehydrogenase E2 component (dihydrolipoamide acetyltransferase)
MGEFRMPSLGADMDEGRLVEWLIKPGDRVHRGDIVALVDTPKAVMDVESFEDGVVETLLVSPGTTVPVGTAMAFFGAGEKRASAGAVESPLVRRRAHELGVDLATLPGTGPGGAITRSDVEHTALGQPTVDVRPPPRPAVRVAASPLARRRAAELGIDLNGIRGSGPGGVVVETDVVAATPSTPDTSARQVAQPRSVVQVPASESDMAAARARAMREVIANLMARAKREIPHYYLSTTIDMSAVTAWLHRANRERPVSGRLVPAALLLKAIGVAVRKMPEINGFWVDGAFVPGSGAHVGVAVALRQGGLVAPAIHDVDVLGVDELMARLRDLVTRARAGRLRQSEMDPTITVTNLGDQGVEAVFGVIYPPQVALVGFGRIAERPWAEDGMLGVRPCVTATLSGDHRASDGHRGGLFLAAIDDLLQRPEEL